MQTVSPFSAIRKCSIPHAAHRYRPSAHALILQHSNLNAPRMHRSRSAGRSRAFPVTSSARWTLAPGRRRTDLAPSCSPVNRPTARCKQALRLSYFPGKPPQSNDRNRRRTGRPECPERSCRHRGRHRKRLGQDGQFPRQTPLRLYRYGLSMNGYTSAIAAALLKKA